MSYDFRGESWYVDLLPVSMFTNPLPIFSVTTPRGETVRCTNDQTTASELIDALKEFCLDFFRNLDGSPYLSFRYEQIEEYDRGGEQIVKELYPQVAVVQRVKGIGPLIAFTFVRILDDLHWLITSRASETHGGVLESSLLD